VAGGAAAAIRAFRSSDNQSANLSTSIQKLVEFGHTDLLEGEQIPTIGSGKGFSLLKSMDVVMFMLPYLSSASRLVPALGMAVSFPVTKLRSETGSSRICFATVISFCKFSGAELSSDETDPDKLSVCARQDKA
jgi:hypothetical protein